MKTGCLENILNTATATCFLGLAAMFILKIEIYMGNEGILPVPPILLLGALVAPLVFIASLRLFISSSFRAVVGRSGSVFLPLLMLVIVGVVGIVFSPTPAVGNREAYFPMLTFVTILGGFLLGFYALRYPRLWKACLIICLLAIIGSIAIDVIYPNTFTLRGLVGPAGFPQNPNGGAMVTLLLLISALDWRKKGNIGWWEVTLVSVALVAIVVTGSRAALLIAIFVLAAYLLRLGKNLFRVRSVLTISTILGFSLFLFAYNREIIVSLLEQTPKVFAIFDVNSSLWSLTDNSSFERLRAASQSIQLIAMHPILGNGTGYSYLMPVGPHNMYLARWVDNGILGLLVYVWLLVAMWLLLRAGRVVWGRQILIVLVIFGFFNHNTLEDRTFLLLLGVAVYEASAVLAVRLPSANKRCGRSQSTRVWPQLDLPPSSSRTRS